MDTQTTTHHTAGKPWTFWLKYPLLALICEKIVQHTVVTVAFYLDLSRIRSTVVVNPDVLMVLGAVADVLFVLSLWGIIRRRLWAIDLVVGLALFDIVGEFVAQGTISITITVSFLVATLLLILALFYRRQERRSGS